jgi:hypothetical protein
MSVKMAGITLHSASLGHCSSYQPVVELDAKEGLRVTLSRGTVQAMLDAARDVLVKQLSPDTVRQLTYEERAELSEGVLALFATKEGRQQLKRWINTAGLIRKMDLKYPESVESDPERKENVVNTLSKLAYTRGFTNEDGTAWEPSGEEQVRKRFDSSVALFDLMTQATRG